MTILKSKIDESVNFVNDSPITGRIETRFVQRPGKDILYLSSQTGCDKLCKMCWLTATGQILYENLSLKDFERQIDVGQSLLRSHGGKNRILHINFMARGEPLSNPILAINWNRIMTYAEKMFPWYDEIVPIISTILPKDMIDLELFRGPRMPRLYWSVYSINSEFRSRWIPNAHSFRESLEIIKNYHHMGGTIRIHFPFIEGENDSEHDVINLAKWMHYIQVPMDVNIIRYNPPNDKSRESPPEIIDRNIGYMKNYMPYANVKIIDRVGEDVYASCGQFIS